MRSVGVDVGGTFTDLVAVGADGAVATRKVLSTPHDQSEGVETAIASLGGMPIGRVVHGTTVATNTLLERNGARVALLATAGFTDLLDLRRQDRASLYDLAVHHPAALVDGADRVAVVERIATQGVLLALDDASALAAARAAIDLDCNVIAIALLHAHANDQHEALLARVLAAEKPGIEVVRSSKVFPEIREYERTATTVAEAYLRPGVARYLRRLEARLRSRDITSFGVMTSSGGLQAASEAAQSAASLALSGPAGGVIGAAAVVRAAGFSDALTIDIGGTSADVGLILGGEPLVEPGGDVAGVPIALPRVLVETVSAGGGSIVWVDDGSALRVGPSSAGARPGPAAFGQGGTAPTLTDAHVVLGHVGATRMSGGVRIDADLARRTMAPIAQRLDATLERVASAAIATADATMARALRRVSVQRGVDPRRCLLVAFGGGGPLHACGLAEQIGMSRVLVPPHAGVLSALGLAIAPERRESMTSVMRTIDAITPSTLHELMMKLEEAAGAVANGVARWWARTRFTGQGHEVDVPLERAEGLAPLTARFATLHHERYGFTLDRPIEIVSMRCSVTGPPWPLDLRGSRNDDSLIRGPATKELSDATLLVRRGWTADPLPIGGWLLERDA